MKVHRLSGFSNINTYYDKSQVQDNVGVEGENIDTTKRTLRVRKGIEPAKNILTNNYPVEVYRHPYVLDCGTFYCWIDDGFLYTKIKKGLEYGGAEKVKRWKPSEYHLNSQGKETLMNEHYLAYPWEDKPLAFDSVKRKRIYRLIRIKTGGGYEAVFTVKNAGKNEDINSPFPYFYVHCRIYYDRIEKKIKLKRIPLYIPTVAEFGGVFEPKNLLTNTFKVKGSGYQGAYEELQRVVGYADDLKYRYIKATVDIDGKEHRIPSLMFEEKDKEFIMNEIVDKFITNDKAIVLDKFFKDLDIAYKKAWDEDAKHDSAYNFVTTEQANAITEQLGKKKELLEEIVKICDDWCDKNAPNGNFSSYETLTHEKDMVQEFVSPSGNIGVDINISIKTKEHDKNNVGSYCRYLYRLICMELPDWEYEDNSADKKAFAKHLKKIFLDNKTWRDKTKKGMTTLGDIKKCAKHWTKVRDSKDYDYRLCKIFDNYTVTLEVVEDRRGLMWQNVLGVNGNKIDDVNEISGTTKEERKALRKQYAEYKYGTMSDFELMPNGLGTTTLRLEDECFLCDDLGKGLYAQEGNQVENKFQKYYSALDASIRNNHVFLNNEEIICGKGCVFLRKYIPLKSKTPFSWFVEDEKILDGDYYHCVIPFEGGILVYARRQGLIYLYKQEQQWRWLVISGKIKGQMKADTEWLAESIKYGDHIYTDFATLNGKRVLFRSTFWRSVVYEIRKSRQVLDTYDEKEKIAFDILCSRHKMKFDSFDDVGRFGFMECKQNDDAIDKGYGLVFVNKKKDDRVPNHGYKQIYFEGDEQIKVKCQNEDGTTEILPFEISFQTQEKKTRKTIQHIKRGDIVDHIVQLEDKDIEVEEEYYDVKKNHYNLVMENEWQGVRGEDVRHGHKYFFDKYGVDFKLEFLKTLNPSDAELEKERVDDMIQAQGGVEKTNLIVMEDEEQSYLWRNYDYVAPYLKGIMGRPDGEKIGAKAIPLTEKEKKDSKAVRRVELTHKMNTSQSALKIRTIELNKKGFIGYYEIPVVARWKSKVLDLGNSVAKKTLQKMIIHIKDGKGSIRLKLWRSGQVLKDYVIYNSERIAVESFEYKAISVPLRQQNIVNFQYEIFITGKVEIVAIDTFYDITRLL